MKSDEGDKTEVARKLLPNTNVTGSDVTNEMPLGLLLTNRKSLNKKNICFVLYSVVLCS